MSPKSVFKAVSDSITEHVQVVMPQHLNGSNKLFGGQLALWIDIVGGITAKRHCNRNILTATIDNLRFRESVSLNEVLVMRGKVTFVGSTSLEVRVDTFAEELSGNRRLINTAFLIQVAVDEEGNPTEVPGLLLQNEFEEQEFAAGKKRKELRKALNKELYD